MVKLDKGSNTSLEFEAGDHLSVFPSNNSAMVDTIIGQLENGPSPDSPIRVKKATPSGDWDLVSRLPAKCTLRQALTSFIDITSPPTQDVLAIFANLVCVKCIYPIRIAFVITPFSKYHVLQERWWPWTSIILCPCSS